MRCRRIALRFCTVSTLLAALACDQPADRLTTPGNGRAAAPPATQLGVATIVNVANVAQLYAAVNDPSNAGATILLAPGIYALSATSGGTARPNGGRLELQQDMSLYGVTGDRTAVTIDASAIPTSSLTVPFGRTAPVRIGRGTNTVAWLTVIGNPSAAAGIATELPGTATTVIQVSHVISGGSSRGLDIRNVGAANAGRRMEAEATDNEFFGPAAVVGMTEGIRVSNFVGANNGIIVATLSGNRVHGFQLGCIFANNRSSNAVIDVHSSGDRFYGNTLGCHIAGGLNQSTSGAANSNTTTVEAHGTQFVNNTAAIPGFDPGGLFVAAGLSTTLVNVASNNTVTVSLWGSKVADNSGDNFRAYGAFYTPGTGIAGTNNHATIELNGVSKKIEVDATPSYGVDPNGTNTVTVIR